jgi:hypothetical protein
MGVEYQVAAEFLYSTRPVIGTKQRQNSIFTASAAIFQTSIFPLENNMRIVKKLPK